MGPRISGFCDIHQGGGEGLVRLVTLRIFALPIQWLNEAAAGASQSKASSRRDRYIGPESPN
jgi:hypothetical protein